MTQSSRQLARTWPYERHETFERQLQAAASTWFAERNWAVNTRYRYILADWTSWQQNIILPEVANYIEQIRAVGGFPLHKYVHHGLSSQAMVFNLVGPLIVRNDLETLRDILSRISWPSGRISARFEYEDRSVFNEDSGQPTSIDLVIGGNDNSPAIFIESKLVEREFGGCSVFAAGDCDGENAAGEHGRCYLHHIGRLYWERLEEFGFLQGPMLNSKVCLLAMYYQFFREVLFALVNHGSFVLLYDQRNPVFDRTALAGRRGLVPFLLQFVPEAHRPQVSTLTIQQVVAAIECSGRHTDWIANFKSKYAMN